MQTLLTSQVRGSVLSKFETLGPLGTGGGVGVGVGDGVGVGVALPVGGELEEPTTLDPHPERMNFELRINIRSRTPRTCSPVILYIGARGLPCSGQRAWRQEHSTAERIHSRTIFRQLS
ncbi:MAG: hypothetical protein C5B49_11990 [Bdellovibrio sp.]|nr:MAG: hypothetical protein C5B49_11990 [Bdellovibrio sp.]